MFLLAAQVRNRSHLLQDRRSPRTGTGDGRKQGTCLESKEGAEYVDVGVPPQLDLRGDSAQSSAAYQAFVPILIIAKSEYANLK